MDSPDYVIFDTSLQEEPLRALQDIFGANATEYRDRNKNPTTEVLSNEIRGITSTVLPMNINTPRLTTIDPEDLSHLPERLSELTLRDYRLDRLPEDFGLAVPLLVILDITHTGLQSLPQSIGRLLNLTTLRVDNNRLTTLPDAVGNLRELRILTADANIGIMEFPRAITNLPRIYWISMSGCSIRAVPSEIGNLSGSLTSLHLRNNNLRGNRVAWHDLSQMSVLRTLNLSDNLLYDLPQSFAGTFPRLNTLYLSNTALTQFPVAVLAVTTLRNLILANNYLWQVPPAISQLGDLEHLNVSGMPTLRVLATDIENLANMRRVIISRFDSTEGRAFAQNNTRILRFLRMTNILLEL